MRAIVCTEHGPADKLVLDQNWPVPALGADDVKIEVKAAALNFPDTLIIQGKYQFQPDMPFVPGAECAGVISEVGENVNDWQVGDKVITIGASGAFAEQLVVSAASAIAMPENMDFTTAAGVAMTYFTSYYALKQRGRVQPGETVVVLGAGGGVGITAVELAKAMGAKVIAAASSAEKLELAKTMGADELINYSEESLKDRIKALTGGWGANVIYDPVGGDYSEQALRAIAWKGRFLVVGFASGPIPKIPLNLTLLKGCEIVGVFWGAFTGVEPEENQKNVDELWQMFAEGKLKPVVTEIYPFEDYVQAFNCLSERRAKGKVILDFT